MSGRGGVGCRRECYRGLMSSQNMLGLNLPLIQSVGFCDPDVDIVSLICSTTAACYWSLQYAVTTKSAMS